MNRSTFTLIMIALATIGYTQAGHLADILCDDPLLCEEKPDIYDSFRNDLDHFVSKNTELISSSSFDDLYDSEIITTGDEENCPSETTVRKPYIIKTNVSSDFVVQWKHFEQKIRVTQCKNAGCSCFWSVVNEDLRLETFCEQKYGLVSLYIYDPDPDVRKFRYKTIPVPVCCSCMYRN